MSDFHLKAFVFALLLYGIILSPVASALNVTRGPYLQRATHNSIIIRWRTDLPSESIVSYGVDLAKLAQSTKYPVRTVEHEVLLTGLTENTKYYYSVGTSSEVLAGANLDYYFVTSPLVGEPHDTRIWVLGDSGTAGDEAKMVRDSYLNYAKLSETDLILMLGDTAYDSGTDAEYQAALFDMYPMILRNKVIWPTMGNHDGYTASAHSQSGPYYDIFNLPRFGEAGGLASGTEAYYSFDYANIHFISLESYETNRSSTGAMATWLKHDLENTTQQWIIAFWHHPPYTRGTYDSDRDGRMVEVRQHILPILEEKGVDLVLGGHSHTYERSFLIDGHYGLSDSLTSSMIIDDGNGREDGAYIKIGDRSHAGTVYIVAGTSGGIGYGELDHPVMSKSLAELGSLVIEVQGERMDVTFLGIGSLPLDHFRIIKKIK